MLARGLGRAVLYLQTHDAAPHRDAILHACTHFVGYDAQAEAGRARYNFDLVEASGERDWYLPRLYHAFATGEDVEDGEHLFELIGLLAQAGDAQSRALMYSVFADNAPKFDTRGAEELVDLDGLTGYVFVARQWIAHPLPEDDQWDEDRLLDHAEKRFGADAVTAALAAAQDEDAGKEADLPAYLAQAREKRRLRNEQRPRRPHFPTPEYKTVRAIVDAPRGRATHYLLKRAGRNADDALLLHLAHDLEAEADSARVLHLLYFFGWRPFPLPPHRLLALAQSDDQDTALAAQAALVHVAHPAVRALALAQIAAGNLWHSVDMLTANSAEEDYALLAEITQRPLPPGEFHDLGTSIRRYVEAYPLPLAIPALLGLYENGLCAFCRHSVVETLLSLAPLPQAILHELAWDANEETRAFADPPPHALGDEAFPAG